jgi:inner membrane protein
MSVTAPTHRFALLAVAGASLAVVAVTDRWLLTSALAQRSMWATGAFDEVAHLATAVIIVAASLLTRELVLSAVAVLLVASVALDIDHVPGLLFHDYTLGWDGRPHTHSLMVCGALTLAAALTPASRRWLPAAVAAGVGIHLVRDLATGPGLPLLWPVSESPEHVAHSLYLALLAALTAACAVAAARSVWRGSAARTAEVPR